MKHIIVIISLILNINSAMLRDDIKEIVIDTTTRLMWDDDYLNMQREKSTWINSISYCNDLNTEFSDWRLPNINELYSIVDTSTYNPSLNENFKYGASDKYWSSTSSKDALSVYNKAWLVDFNTSKTYSLYDKIDIHYTRCVRDY